MCWGTYIDVSLTFHIWAVWVWGCQRKEKSLHCAWVGGKEENLNDIGLSRMIDQAGRLPLHEPQWFFSSFLKGLKC